MADGFGVRTLTINLGDVKEARLHACVLQTTICIGVTPQCGTIISRFSPHCCLHPVTQGCHIVVSHCHLHSHCGP
jgi:hypothetical protein